MRISKLFPLLMCLLLFSCSAPKRLSNFMHRHPELIKKDTTFKDTVVITKESHADTAFYYHSKDTVYLNSGKLQVKYYFNKDSTVYIAGKCKPDTLRIRYPVYINSISVEKYTSFFGEVKMWLEGNAIMLLIAMAVLSFVLFFRKSK